MGSIDGNGEIINGKAKSRRSRSRGFGPGPGEGIRASQPSSGRGLGAAFQLPKEDLAGAARLLRACVAEPLRTITAILPGSTWSCLFFCVLCCTMR